MVRKNSHPEINELVICKITRINPNSVFVHIKEYDMEGMIHISEVSSGWVRDIRRHVKLGDELVAKILRLDPLSLSIKRVSGNQKIQKMREYKLEQRAEKMLEMAARKLNKNLDVAYDELGFMLQDRFGSLYESFKMILQKPQLVKKYIPDDWFSVLKDVVEKNIEEKEFEFRARLFLKSFKPEGINIIKNILLKAKDMNLDVRYIAAPEYLVKYTSKNAKKGEKEFLERLNKVTAMAEEGKFEIIE